MNDTQTTHDGRTTTKNDPDRLPPYSREVEEAVLGCIFGGSPEEANQAMDACEERGVADGWFYDLRTRLVWAGCHALHGKGTPPDPITLREWMIAGQHLDKQAATECVSELMSRTNAPSMLEHYLGLLWEKWVARRIVQVGSGMVARVYAAERDDTIPVGDLLAAAEKEVLKLSEERAQSSEERMKAAVLRVMEKMEDYHRGKAQLTGLTTGLTYVDKLLGGIGQDNGNYVVLSGRPSTGKTSLVTQIAAHASMDYEWFEPVVETRDNKTEPVLVKDENGRQRFKMTRKQGLPVGIFSLEMATNALVQRMLFQRSGADMQRWRTGFADAGDIPKIVSAASAFAGWDNVIIDDTARLSIDVLKARARRYYRQYGIKLFIVDYIQLMRAGGRRFREDRVQELAEVSAEIQLLGKELNVPFIILAQMNRDYEKDPNRQPRLSDLKDCGSIEQDADVVGFLYTPRMKAEAEEFYENVMEKEYPGAGGRADWSRAPARVDVLFAKNRYGPTGNCQLLFQKSATKFYDWNEWLVTHGYKAAASGQRGRVVEQVEMA